MMLGWWLVFGAAMYRVVGDSMEYSFKMQLTEESAKRPECSPVQCQEVGNSRNEVVACLTAAAPLCAYNVKLEMNGYTDEYVADCAELGDRLMTLHLNLSQYGTMNLSRLSGVVRLTLQSPSFSDCYVYSVFSDGSECDSAMAADGMVGFMRTGDTQFEADLGQLTPRGRRVMMGLATNFHVGFCGNGISRLELDRVTYEVTVRTHSRRDEWESTLSGPNATFLYFLPAENSPADCYLAECALGPLSYAQVDACARRVAEYCEMHGQYIINHSQVDGTCEDQKGPGNFTRIAVRLDVLHIFGTTKSVSIAQPPLLRMKTGAARTCRSFLLAVETCPISDDATPTSFPLRAPSGSFSMAHLMPAAMASLTSTSRKP
eukprot:Gregarina_sp_Poly_1__3308@NODE_1950_length_3011_cov_111_514266_g1241_i1_p2_GENE_NODE_1950_length_3011_cov_111_514266_g1241_i1NODE_1950_length_3011_cov_111_514266_g1241_i1_p2_ORF_typecomplete_len375_score27_29_NODE_1950_length_3011_cov_111_514266_g1241_i116402764